VQPLPRHVPQFVSESTSKKIDDEVVPCTSFNVNVHRCGFVHRPSVGAWLCAAPRGELLARVAEEQMSQLSSRGSAMLQSQLKEADAEVSCVDSKVSEDQLCETEVIVESVDQSSPQMLLFVRLDGDASCEPKQESIVDQPETCFDVVAGLELDNVDRVVEVQDDKAKDEACDENAPSPSLDSEDDSEDGSEDDSEEESDEESASDEECSRQSEEETNEERVRKEQCSEADSESKGTTEQPIKPKSLAEADRESEDSSDNETSGSDEETDDDSQEDSAEDTENHVDQRPSPKIVETSFHDKSRKTQGANDLIEISPAEDVQKTMSATALWRAGILGLESPSSSPSKVSPVRSSRPPHAPPFEVAKLSPTLQVDIPNVAKGDHVAQGSDQSFGGNRVIDRSKHKASRCMSEGRIPHRQMDSRVAVSHTRPSPSERQPPERHIDSLKARAKAPAPLPRHVPPPQNACTLKYAPPLRDVDSWEYEKILPRDIVQVVRLESKPYIRKGRKEMEQDIVSRPGKSKINGLSGIYRPLVQNQERRPPRVQSLPSLPASSRSHQLVRDVQLGSPQRFTGIC